MNKTIIFDEKSCQWSKNELVNAWTLGAYECRLNDIYRPADTYC